MRNSKIAKKLLFLFMTIIMIFPVNLVHATMNGLEDSSEKITVVEEKETDKDTTNNIVEDLEQKELEDLDTEQEIKEETKNKNEESIEEEDKVIPTEEDKEEQSQKKMNEENIVEEENDYSTDILNLGKSAVYSNSSPQIQYKTNRYIKDGRTSVDEYGYITVVSEMWAESEKIYEPTNYDIVILYDQSKAAIDDRTTILNQTSSFLTRLENTGEHKIALLGYGRINSPMNSNPNTGFYSSGNFISNSNQGIRWNPDDYKPNISNYNPKEKPFMGIATSNIIVKNRIVDWNVDAARLDVGLTLAKRIFEEGRDNSEKVLLVFSNAIATQKKLFGTEDKSGVAIEIADELKKTNVNIMTIGQHKPFSKEDWDTKDNFTAQMNGVASKDDGEDLSFIVDNANSYEDQLAKVFKRMTKKITGEATIKEEFSEMFTIEESEVYKQDFKSYNDSDIWHKKKPEPEENPVIKGNTINYDRTLVPIPSQKNDPSDIRGSKIIVETKLKVKDEFLGGNNVPVVTDVEANENMQVDISIPELTVEAEDKNVYLMNNLSKEDILKNSSASYERRSNKEESIPIELEKNNFGLKDWQDRYVDLNIFIDESDISQKDLEDLVFSKLEEDEKYTLQIKAKSKSGDAKEQSADKANINVFKPEVTNSDLEYHYGDTKAYEKNKDEPVVDLTQNKFLDNDNNKVSVLKWKHKQGETVLYADSESVAMFGDPHTILYEYESKSNEKDLNFFKGPSNEGATLNTKKNILVNVKGHIMINGVKKDITDHIKFKNSSNGNSDSNDESQFTIHAKTATLKITKTGGTKDESYVFEIQRNGDDYTEGTIVRTKQDSDSITIYELPVGKYTVKENTDWSWRYDTKYTSGNKTVSLDREKFEGEITVTNTKQNNNWLNSFSKVIENIYGEAKENSKWRNR